MKKVVIFSFVSILLFLVMFYQAQAMIFISEPNDIYNLGDNLDITTKVSYSEQIQGFLEILLVCNEQEQLMYFSPMIIETTEKTVDVSFPVSEAIGTCHVSISIQDNKKNVLETLNTKDFSLSDKINIFATLNKEEFEPSDNLEIEGQVIKANGESITGNIKINIGGQEHLATITAGDFSYQIGLSETILPGQHKIILSTEDINGNKGNTTLIFNVKQIPTTIVIETNNESFLPDEILLIKVKILDQAEEIINKSIDIKLIARESVILFFSKDEILLEESLESEKETIYRFAKDMPPGDYLIETVFEDLKLEKTISVQTLEKLEFILENNTLIITNVGNIPYKKPIEMEFKIHDQTTIEIIDVDLDVGETKVFKLEAPKGNYDLSIKGEGKNINDKDDVSANFSDLALTGNVVATIEMDEEPLYRQWWIWIIPLIMALVFLAFFLTTQRKKGYIIRGKTTDVKKERVSSKTLKKIEEEKKVLGPIEKGSLDIKKIFNKHSSKLAAQTIMPSLVYGTKKEISVLLMTISGFDKLQMLKKKDPELFKKAFNSYFDAIIKKIKLHQGVADLYGNNLVVFFNIVNQYRHDIAAIKTAQDIKKITISFNESIKQLDIELKIKAGINSGLVNISSIGADKSVKYTAIGNTISLARALKNKAFENEILIPESIYSKVANMVKTKKLLPLHLTDKRAINVYSLQDTSQLYIKEKYTDYVKRKI